MRARDTSQAAHEHQLRLYRAMKDQDRAALALQMSDDARRITIEGIQQRHSEYNAEDLRQALVALLYGPELAAKVLPGAPVKQP